MLDTLQFPVRQGSDDLSSIVASDFSKPNSAVALNYHTTTFTSELKRPRYNNNNNNNNTRGNKRRAAMESYKETLNALRISDPDFVHLELHGYTVPSSVSPFDLIQAIRLNKSVRTVEIWKEFLLELTTEQGRNLFEAIGDLPRCERLFCDFPNPRDGFPLQLHALTCVLTGSSPLRTVSLRNVVLKRHEHELAEALQLHRYLREFQLKNLELVDRNVCLDPIFTALAHIPTLKLVEIRMKRKQSGALSISSLRELAKSKSLLIFKLWHVKLSEEMTVLLADALQKNRALKSLTLFDCSLTRHGYDAIAQMLRVNTTLSELQLYDANLDDASKMAIARGLERNSSLQALTIQPLVPFNPYGR